MRREEKKTFRDSIYLYLVCICIHFVYFVFGNNVLFEAKIRQPNAFGAADDKKKKEERKKLIKNRSDFIVSCLKSENVMQFW